MGSSNQPSTMTKCAMHPTLSIKVHLWVVSWAISPDEWLGWDHFIIQYIWRAVDCGRHGGCGWCEWVIVEGTIMSIHWWWWWSWRWPYWLSFWRPTNPTQPNRKSYHHTTLLLVIICVGPDQNSCLFYPSTKQQNPHHCSIINPPILDIKVLEKQCNNSVPLIGQLWKEFCRCWHFILPMGF